MGAELQRSAAIELSVPSAPALPAAALERLPGVKGNTDPYWRLVTAFLVGYPPHSSRAYFSGSRPSFRGNSFRRSSAVRER